MASFVIISDHHYQFIITMTCLLLC